MAILTADMVMMKGQIVRILHPQHVQGLQPPHLQCNVLKMNFNANQPSAFQDPACVMAAMIVLTELMKSHRNVQRLKHQKQQLISRCARWINSTAEMAFVSLLI